MAIRKVACPGCQSTLNYAQELPAALRCPRCQARFKVGLDGAAQLQVDEPELAGNGGRIALLTGVFGGGALFLLLGAGLLVYCLAAGSKPVEDDDPPLGGGPPPKAVTLEPVAFVKTVGKNAKGNGTCPGGRPDPASPMGIAKGAYSQEVLLPANQKEIDAAIAKGVAYLLASLDDKDPPRGKGHAHTTGGLALAGLTLLSCDVPVDNAKLIEVIRRIRAEAPTLTRTYDLAVCVWFLDKLGQTSDRELIRTISLRLIAGQGKAGGWGYSCQVISGDQEKQILAAIAERSTKPLPPPPAGAPGGGDKLPKVGGVPKAVDVSQLAILHWQPGQTLPKYGSSHEDNSLTQFAVLALWIARKYEVPTHLSLAMAEARFRQNQAPEGTWPYVGPHVNKYHCVDSMTCAGLVALAVGRGLDHGDPGSAPRDFGKDPQVEKALGYLGERIGRADLGLPKGELEKLQKESSDLQLVINDKSASNEDKAKALARRLEVNKIVQATLGGDARGKTIHASSWGDYYFLWSLERLAVVYNLRTIGGQDWYKWGSDIILANQTADGSWQDTYKGAVDTCFALLFLKRVNVVTDLTEVLKNLGGVRDPGGKGGEHETGGAEEVGGNKVNPLVAPGAVKVRNGYALPANNHPRPNGRRRRRARAAA
jgi:hypothetical protein